MTPKTLVKELMVPLQEYAIVGENETLCDALLALNEAQKHLKSGQQPHRAVLVQNAEGVITGKVGHLAFLRALLPKQDAYFSEKLIKRANVSNDLMAQATSRLQQLLPEFTDHCERARFIKVRDVMLPLKTQLRYEDTIMKALEMFDKHQTLSILVRKDNAAVGVLRLSDLFDQMSAYICSMKNQ